MPTTPAPPPPASPTNKYAHLTAAQRRCSPAACAIQSCLRRHGYNEGPCKATIRAYHACVERAQAEEANAEAQAEGDATSEADTGGGDGHDAVASGSGDAAGAAAGGRAGAGAG